MSDENERSVASAGSVRPEQVESRKMSLDEFAAAIDAETRTLPVQNMTHLTLTDEERIAIEHGIAALLSDEEVFGWDSTPHAATLRSLLERLK